MALSELWQKSTHLLLARAPAILLATFLFIIGWWLIRLLYRHFSNRIQDPHVDPSIKPFMLSLIMITLRIVLILTVLQIAGFKLTIFTVLLGALGVAAGLALSGTLQNFTSGVLILLFKPFHAGDRISTQGKEGTISSIQIFYTEMTSEDNSITIIPNSKLSNEIIVNTTACEARKIETTLKFPYATNWPALKDALEEIIDALKVNRTWQGPGKPLPSRVGILMLEPDGYTVAIHVWAPSHAFKEYKFSLSEALLNQLKQRGLLPGT